MRGYIFFFGSFGLLMLSIIGVHTLNEYYFVNYLDKVSTNGSGVIYNQSPEDYQANSHVVFNANVSGGKYLMDFKFKGPKNKMWNWKWTLEESATDKDILLFGVPKSIFDPYYPVDSVIQKRNRWMKNGLFIQDGRYIKPDLIKMVNYYRKYLHPLALKTQESLTAEDTWRDYIEFFMKVCQDIPYGVPPKNFDNKYIGGVFPPPQVFVNKFGDCDSKAVLFCAGVSFFKNTETLLLFETGHVLPAVKGVPKPYDAFYEYQNEKYIMADTAGPGRAAFGFNANPYQKVNKVSKVIIQ